MNSAMDYQNPPLEGLAGAASPTFSFLFYLFIFIAWLISMPRIFTKAGKSGWASIVPIYNLVVLLDICRKPRWWVLLFLVPLVNIVYFIRMYLGLARVFGKGIVFGIGLFLLPVIFEPILAFGGAKYVGDEEISPSEAWSRGAES